MTFLFVGLVLLGVTIYFLRQAIRQQDKYMIIGMTMLIVAAAILILVYGLFYTLTIT